ncbi:hypothetical protein HOE22_02375 [Candidatus Woesearchaeota archaeon]|jgi:hypothetical protein|nr:hypothetical protein [Candidatus Woesearchaeota archaeon]MBT4731955.1 hypothetical protein [Candidatus Woesearchaeota archaeon]MBT7556455.1 hypothetical protein [Candidatus Woesearchaeota archaeon]
MLRKNRILEHIEQLQLSMERLRSNLFDAEGKVIPVKELAGRLEIMEDKISIILNLIELEDE